MKSKIKLSPISLLHFIKLFYRSALFLAAAIFYIVNRIRKTGSLFGSLENMPMLLNIIWLVLAVEMFFRFFPSSLESMGCQKQFRRNYLPIENTAPKNQSAKTTFLIVLAWFALNGVLGALHIIGILDDGIMLLISLAYSVCDIICILFFCPFQTWFMKNRCCTTCRIYNWDFAMMFTPLVFVPHVYTWSLLGLALALLIAWEVRYHRYPERFSEATNSSLHCENCQEKLCHHKKQLHSFWQKNKNILNRFR